MNVIVNLCVFPEKYKRIRQSEDIRKMVLEQYVVIYKLIIKIGKILILHIFHGNQDYFSQL